MKIDLNDEKLRRDFRDQMLAPMRRAVEVTSPLPVYVVRQGEDRFPHSLVRVSSEFQFRLFGREVVFFNKKSVKVDRDAFLDSEHGVSGAGVGHDDSVGGAS